MKTPLKSFSSLRAFACCEPMIAAACFEVTFITLRSEKSKARSAATHAAVSPPTPCTTKLLGGLRSCPAPLPMPLGPSGRSMTTPYCFSKRLLYRKLTAVTSCDKSTTVLTMLPSSISSGLTPLLDATRPANLFLSLSDLTDFSWASLAAMRFCTFSRNLFMSSWNFKYDSQRCAFDNSWRFPASISSLASAENDNSSVWHCLSSFICSRIFAGSGCFGRGHFASRSVASSCFTTSSRRRRCSTTSFSTCAEGLSSGTD
mmetsp:Transcript_29246/g.84023  ORF Transcript_29246/g.84023 Transcript_29246/m.84023 type:complete len:259 (-) Transcript_29246:13-789(-)